MDCVFCKIVAGEIPADILYQDEQVIAFRDINPQAPVHVLVIPREHIPSVVELSGAESSLVENMVSIASQLAVKEGVSGSGYRLVINCGEQGGQLVPHLHLHLLGGRQLAGELG